MRRLSIAVVFVVLVVTTGYAQVGKSVVRAVVTNTSKRALHLNVLSHEAAALAKQQEHMLARQLNHSLQSSAREYSSFAIEATPRAELRLFAYQLPGDVTQEKVSHYYQTMKAFSEFKKSWDTRMFYIRLNFRENRLSSQERLHYIREAFELRNQIKGLLSFLFKEDRALKKASQYLAVQLETLEPLFKGKFVELARPVRYDQKPFNEAQFFLRSPDGDPYRDICSEDFSIRHPNREAAVLKQAAHLPSNLRIAVLNDTPIRLASFNGWAQAGFLGEGATVKPYLSVSALLEDIKYGTSFDLIISDLMVPGGGGEYLVYTLRSMDIKTPAIALSEYKEADVKAAELYNLGFDGYLQVDDGFKSLNGYRVVPTALRHFFDYRK